MTKPEEIYWHIPFHAYETDNGKIEIFYIDNPIGKTAKNKTEAKFIIDNLAKGYYNGYEYMKDSKFYRENGYSYLKVGSTLEPIGKGKNEKRALSAFKLMKEGAEMDKDGGMMAKGGGVYSSEDAYKILVFSDDKLVEEKIIRAKNNKEANEIAEDMEPDFKKKYGTDLLRVRVEKAGPKMAEGGNTDGYDPNMKGYSVVYSKIIDGKESNVAYKIDVAALNEEGAKAEAKKRLSPMNVKIESVRQYYEDGGNIGGSNARHYFKSLNLAALPKNAAAFIDTQILSDPDIELLDDKDEDFVAVKDLISEDYPAAVSGKESKPETPEVEAGSQGDEKAEWKDAIETLQMLVDAGGSKKDISEWKDAIETLQMLTES